jgi:hypothetical protein
VNASRITKIAGVSFAGFVAAAFLADKVNLNPVASQLSGFAGAFFGTLVARRRGAKRASSQKSEPPRPASPASNRESNHAE